MMNVSNMIAAIQPELIRCEWGGWLAVSAPGSVLRIGTIGETEDAARRTFESALRAWAILSEEAQRAKVDLGPRT